MNKKQICITLGCVCLLLTTAIFIQIKTINNANKAVPGSNVNNQLKDQVLRWKEKYDTTYQNLQESEKTLDNVRKKAMENTNGSEEKNNELKKNNMLLGLTNVQGEGVTITMKDNNSKTVDSISPTDDISLYLVHDIDIRSIVNELENAGAEAISVNNQRIVSSTSITCEGNVISINGEKVSSPFIIKAIGNSFGIYSALTRPGGTVELLNSTGIVTTVKQSDNITINKYSGVLNSKYIKYQAQN